MIPTSVNKTPEIKENSRINSDPVQDNSNDFSFEISDTRKSTVAQRQLQEIADNSAQMQKAIQFQKMANQSSTQKNHDIPRQSKNNKSIENVNDQPIQRVLLWQEGIKTHVNNMTDPLLILLDFGTTPVILNTTEIPGGNVTTAITEPAFLIRPMPEGTVELSVHAEAVNTISFRMELPSAPPWQSVTSWAHAKSALSGIGIRIEGGNEPLDDQQVTVRAHGLPSDAGFAALVEQHESHHVEELIMIITTHLAPWDDAISRLKTEGRTFVGRDEADAKAQFYAAVGGTPAQIATAFEDALRQAGMAYHSTQEGGAPTIDRAVYDATSNVLSAYWRHPLS